MSQKKISNLINSGGRVDGYNLGEYVSRRFESVMRFKINGVISSVGRALDCGSKGRRFEPDITPKWTYEGNAWPVVSKRSYRRQRDDSCTG